MNAENCPSISDEEKEALLQQSRGVTIPPKPSGYGTRHTLTILAFWGFFNVYCMRVNLSVALVAMVNSSNSQSNASITGECPAINNQSVSNDATGEFNWDEDTQGIILGSFYYGYIITQLPAGRLAEIFGAKILFGTGILVTSILSLITPFAARLGVGAFIAVRVLEGLGEGVTFPAMHAMLGKWAPSRETSTLSNFIYGGTNFGTFISMPVSGLLCGSAFLGGWPSVFYVFGVVGCIWFVFWMIFIYDAPSKHPRISEEEKQYIEQSLGKTKQKLPIPWKSIFTSPALWAIAVAHTTASWGFYTLLSCLPTYMNKIQKYDITQDGLLVSLPYLASWISAVLCGILADAVKNNCLSTTVTRKLFTLVGLAVGGSLQVLIKQAGCDHTMVVVILIASMTIGGMVNGGFLVNHLDIAPNFAGTLMGITNGLSTAAGMLAPYVVGILTDNNQTMNQWQIVFYISTGLYIFGAVVYVIFGKGNLQKWNNPKYEIVISPERSTPEKLSSIQS